MTQRAAGAFWDCDAPTCHTSSLGQLDQEPEGWGMLIDEASGEHMDLCDQCMEKVRKAINA